MFATNGHPQTKCKRKWVRAKAYVVKLSTKGEGGIKNKDIFRKIKNPSSYTKMVPAQ